MSRRVLFVDDDPPVLQALCRNLNFELDISTAHSGSAALALLSGPGAFDVVVTDLLMPGMNGMDFVDQASSQHPEIPFIILSGCNDEALLNRARRHPAVQKVLAKPAKLRSLLQTIECAAPRPITALGNLP